MHLPDVVGFTLKEAQKLLAGAGIEIIGIDVTAPPKERSSTYDNSFRVIRLHAVNEKQVQLLLCSAYNN